LRQYGLLRANSIVAGVEGDALPRSGVLRQVEAACAKARVYPSACRARVANAILEAKGAGARLSFGQPGFWLR